MPAPRLLFLAGFTDLAFERGGRFLERVRRDGALVASDAQAAQQLFTIERFAEGNLIDEAAAAAVAH